MSEPKTAEVKVPAPNGWADWPRESYDRRYEIGMREDAAGGASCPMCETGLDQSDAVVIVNHNGSLALCHVACLPDECPLNAPASPPAETGEGSLESVTSGTGRMTVVSMLAAVSNAIACIRASQFGRGVLHEHECDKRADELNRARNRLIEALNTPSDTERMRAFVKNVAASDWTETDLQYLAVNVRHSRGSLKLETKRDAASAALTLKAILIEARAALAEKEAG